MHHHPPDAATLDILLGGWKRGLMRDLPHLESRLAHIEAEAQAGRARFAMKGLDRVTQSVIAVHGGRELRRLGDRLAPLVARAIAEEDSRCGEGEVSWTLLTLADTWNALACAGCAESRETTAIVAGWLPRMHVGRDDPDTTRFHWRLGFAALALARPAAYRPIAGYNANGAIPFLAEGPSGLDLQGALSHLSGAVEAKASIDDVMPMWIDLLGALPILVRARTFDLAGVQWVARTMTHRLAGRPVGETADFVRDSIARVARSTSS